MSRKWNRASRVLPACLIALTALSGCGREPATAPAAKPDAPSNPAGAPKGSEAHWNDPVWHASGGTQTSGSLTPKKENKPEDLTKAKPDLKLSIEEWLDKSKTDAENLREKVVDVTGVVSAYRHSADGTGDLVLGPGNNPFWCGYYPMAKAAPGQTVTIRSRWQQNIGFARWEIIQVEGKAPPVVTAERLAADVKADEKGTAAKLGKGYIIVTGTIRKLDEAQYRVYLTESGAKPEIWCHIGPLGWQAAEKDKWLEVGKSVRIMGEPDFSGVDLSSAVILPPKP